jgi:hypothetical protein
MGKRFRDTGLWDKDWYISLSCSERSALDYVLCRCDAVGVWCPAFVIAEKLIGEKVEWEKLPPKCNGNIAILDNGKWWIRDFCKYQYGHIKADSSSKVQIHLHALLVGHGLWDTYISTVEPTTVGATVEIGVAPTPKEKEKEKEKEKVKEKDPKVCFDFSDKCFLNIPDETIERWRTAYPACDIDRELRKMREWILSNPTKGHKSNWSKFITNWLSRSQDRGGTK